MNKLQQAAMLLAATTPLGMAVEELPPDPRNQHCGAYTPPSKNWGEGGPKDGWKKCVAARKKHLAARKRQKQARKRQRRGK